MPSQIQVNNSTVVKAMQYVAEVNQVILDALFQDKDGMEDCVRQDMEQEAHELMKDEMRETC